MRREFLVLDAILKTLDDLSPAEIIRIANYIGEYANHKLAEQDAEKASNNEEENYYV